VFGKTMKACDENLEFLFHFDGGKIINPPFVDDIENISSLNVYKKLGMILNLAQNELCESIFPAQKYIVR
jgi:hypothetical protein